jgi:hypothetical protein
MTLQAENRVPVVEKRCVHAVLRGAGMVPPLRFKILELNIVSETHTEAVEVKRRGTPAVIDGVIGRESSPSCRKMPCSRSSSWFLHGSTPSICDVRVELCVRDTYGGRRSD